MQVLIAVLHRPSKPTGVCRHAANLARCLADRPDVSAVTLVTGRWQRHHFETAFSLSSEKIKIIDIDIQNNSVARNLWFLFGLPRLVNQLRPNLVHLAFPLPFWRSRFSCPVVATIHDLYPYECPENFGRLQAVLNRLFLRQCISQSDGLTCVSEVTLKQLQRFFPEHSHSATVNYNYVDFSGVEPQPPAAFAALPEQPFLLSIAQHRKNKNLHLLIQAYAALVKSGQLPDSLLVLVGSTGPETAALEQQIAELRLSQSVLLLASLSDGEICWLYRRSQLYVVCSSTEGFCLPLVEALYLGSKAVCSDIPIFREVAQSDCTYFSLEGDPAQNLADAIALAIQQPASSHPVLRFSKSAIAAQYIDFYRKTMA